MSDTNRTISAGKIEQVMGLMKTLKLKTEARQRVGRDGFLEMVVLFVDLEKYPDEEKVEVPPFVPLEPGDGNKPNPYAV